MDEPQTKVPRLRRRPKLTPEQEAAMCDLYEEGELTVKEIAKQYGVSTRKVHYTVESARKAQELQEASA